MLTETDICRLRQLVVHFFKLVCEEEDGAFSRFWRKAANEKHLAATDGRRFHIAERFLEELGRSLNEISTLPTLICGRTKGAAEQIPIEHNETQVGVFTHQNGATNRATVRDEFQHGVLQMKMCVLPPVTLHNRISYRQQKTGL